MKKTPAGKFPSIRARIAHLRRRHHDLAARIEDEQQRPVPCSMVLRQLKRQRLLLKDQIARYDAMLRCPDRTRAPAQAA